MNKNQIGQWVCADLQDMRHCAAQIIALIKSGKILLEGPLGAGKTTLVQYFGQELAVEELMTSPTYSLINLYSEGRVAHLDLYRLSTSRELEVLGLDELESEWVFIEWGERFESSLYPLEALIRIELVEKQQRLITLYSYD